MPFELPIHQIGRRRRDPQWCGMSSRERNNGVWRRGVRATPSRTTACSRRPPAYAALRLPGAAEAQRSASMERRGSAYDRREERTMWYSAVGCLVTLTLSLLTTPLAAEAQPAAKVWRIGYLTPVEVP